MIYLNREPISITITGYEGQTQFQHAVVFEHLEIMQLLRSMARGMWWSIIEKEPAHRTRMWLHGCAILFAS